jgi:hypothetical protein
MLYDWDMIAASGPQLILESDGSTSTGAQPA